MRGTGRKEPRIGSHVTVGTANPSRCPCRPQTPKYHPQGWLLPHQEQHLRGTHKGRVWSRNSTSGAQVRTSTGSELAQGPALRGVWMRHALPSSRHGGGALTPADGDISNDLPWTEDQFSGK